MSKPYIQLVGVILVGELSLWVALLMATWGATVSFAGGHLRRSDLIESGERAIYATLALVVLASAGLLTALITHDFSIRYVASFTSRNLPLVYTIAAFWGGPSGSLLFWALILATLSAIALWTNRTRNRELMPYVSGTLAVILVFFLATICLGSNPYERLDWIPPDGLGLDPRLQNPAMVIHPPTLYSGYISTSIPFAFAIAALVTRRLDAEWLAAVRRWALFSWFFLTVGITLGMWWAYIEPGWGGYWAWDPVRNASLLPWLVNTAFLYLVTVEEKRGLPRLVTRHFRRYGAYLVGVGVVMIFAALVGMAFRKEYDFTLKVGESRTVTDPWGRSWTFLSQGISTYNILNREVTAIALDLTRDGERAGVITSEQRQHVDSRGARTFEPSTEAGIRSSFEQDVYVVLAGVKNADEVELRVSFNPLVVWVWIGAALLALGGLVVMWPAAERVRPPESSGRMSISR